jgi:hypothetical protein
MALVSYHNITAITPDIFTIFNKSKIASIKKDDTTKKWTHILTVGGFYALEPLTFITLNQKMLSHPGVFAKIKLFNFFASARLNYFSKMVNDQQVMEDFSDVEYAIGIVGKKNKINGKQVGGTGFILGYYPTNWVKSIYQVKTLDEINAHLDDNPNHITAVDANGNYYGMSNVLIKTHIPTYSFGYKMFGGSKTKLFQNDESKLDDYDLKHKGKIKSALIYDMSIELLYAPKIGYDTTLIYSPYGLYTPHTLYLTKHFKEKHFGVKLQMNIHTQFGAGLMMEMGIKPGIINLDDDYKKANIYMKVGLLFNLNLIK